MKRSSWIDRWRADQLAPLCASVVAIIVAAVLVAVAPWQCGRWAC